MNIQIRKGTAGDIKEILNLCIKLAEYEGSLIGKVPNSEEIAKRVEKDLVDDNQCAYFVAEHDGNIVAIIKINDRGNGIGRISEAYTKPEYRNNGIMTALFNRTIEWAIEHNLRIVYLTIVRKNDNAYRFWRSLGFGNDEYISETVIKMYRDIEKIVGS